MTAPNALDAPDAPNVTAEPTGTTGGELHLGKRYGNEDGTVELLCTKPGSGVLTVGNEPLGIRAAKALPASD